VQLVPLNPRLDTTLTVPFMCVVAVTAVGLYPLPWHVEHVAREG
jgi:hypothetical protein